MHDVTIAHTDWYEGLKIGDLSWGRIPASCEMRVASGIEGGKKECLVEAVTNFPGGKPGELSLEKGDVVRVERKIAGGCGGGWV